MNGKKPSAQKRSCGSDIEAKDVPLKHKLMMMFWTLGPAFTRWTESRLEGTPLTPQRLRLSELLFDNGPSRMCELRDALGVTATNITALVDALESDGMVERVPHPTDRRATLIQLTPKAHKTITFGCTQYKDRVAELFEGFSASEQEQLFRLLKKTRDALVEREILESPREEKRA
jgi:DNA-binding MarR family transcriptional regulator